ncbi:type VI secretion system tip protein VgrG [Dyadobacter fanqingshengii]|uniref:Type VI secretion system tip protein VgrG n=1 Tax=Dyadobacter fanqingshengii TaxID=2906443 RepID=A0A9X1P837_9BACT|nr:type VI secretion system tip protein VgrG [Dyadobacter fanqingshengii]MCF0039775.1 type VI secretion system tip protein VgrG [Dyadobacter fanqingshengii]USJ38462.1 type VI secretion system tip protein VgrG [Dyadobacter fanqingshengii]
MPLVATSTETNPSLATYKIFSDGTELPASVGVAMISVQKAINKIPSARLVLYDGDVAEADFELSGGDLFIPGKEVEIRAGYNNFEESVFKGIIIRHGLEVTEKASKLTIDLKDPVVKMTVGRKNKYFFESKDSEIIEEIIGSYTGLSSDIEATTATHPEMVQYYVTDWDFIVTRAEVNGKISLIEDGKVRMLKPETSADARLELQYGTNVVEFQAEIDARTQYSSSKSISWDLASQELKEVEGSDPGMDFQSNLSGSDLADVIGLSDFRLQHSGGLDDQELQAWADATLMRSRLSKIQGQVKILGDNTIKPGDMVSLAGFGDRFNGKAFVSSVYHEISPNRKWFTHLGLGLDSKFLSSLYDDVLDVPAAGLVPAIQGLHIGVVTSLDDPLGEHRVRIFIPVIDPGSEGTWARTAAPDAGEGDNARGIFFMPEIGDEVIVGFINEDPRDPVILGKLFSSAKPAPFTQNDDNHQKGIVTRSQLKLVFDDEKKFVTIKTPKGNKVTLSDDEGSILLEDENGNKVTLNAKGISLESAKDIILKASGDVKIEGANIEIKASAQMKAEGGAGAEFSSSASTKVKGSIVQIN